VPQRDLGALGAGDPQTAPAHHVLAHVEDINAGLSILTLTGRRVSVTRNGSAICAASTPAGAATMCAGAHLESSKPARFQPDCSMRASYSSPSYSLLARMGPALESFQVSSETNARSAAVLVLDIQAEDGLGSPKLRVSSGIDARGAIAAVAEHQADGVTAGGDLFGDVEGDVEHVLVVVGETG